MVSEIYEAAFADELEKMSTCRGHKGVKPKKAKTAEMVKKSSVVGHAVLYALYKKKHKKHGKKGKKSSMKKHAGSALVNRAIPGLAGGLYGFGLGTAIFNAMAIAQNKKTIPEFKKKIVEDDTASIDEIRKSIGKRYPELNIVSTKKELRDVKDVNALRRLMIQMYTPVKGNALYAVSKKSPIIVLPEDKINKFVAGHEAGHHQSFKDSQKMKFLGKAKRIVGPRFVEESKAWDLSPYAGEKGEEGIKNLALNSYKAYHDAAKRSLITAAAGAGIGTVVGNSDLTQKALSAIKKAVKKGFKVVK